MPIPFKDAKPELPNNRCVAEKRLQLLGRRLNQDDELRDKYLSGMKDLFDKGYAEPVPEDQLNLSNGKVWYLPHHPVINPNKPGKVRIVFDCASRYQGISLNDKVSQGPDLTNKLIGVLQRYRLHPVTLVSDIEGMYNQVRVTPRDRDVLHFLWWKDGDMDNSPCVYRMATHLFGGVWSPSCATYTLRHTAQVNQGDYDKDTVNTVHDNFYVDDCLKSTTTEEEAISLAENLTKLLQKGGFRLTKFISNRRSVLKTIPVDKRAKEVTNIDLDKQQLPSGRVLGVHWNIETDNFEFKICIKEKPLTRRGIISIISSIYDPLGFVSPCILVGKMIFQEVCRKKMSWDEPLDEPYLTSWNSWLESLPALKDFSVPRCLYHLDINDTKSCELHHFSDASQTGYGAVSYLRIVDRDDKVLLFDCVSFIKCFVSHCF